MSKEEFLKNLSDSLNNLCDADKNEILEYYEELISDAVENGKEEKEFISKLDSIDSIVKKIKLEKIVKEVNDKPTIKNKISAIFSMLGIITSPIWFPVAIVFVLVIFILIICGFIIVISMALVIIALILGLIKSFTYLVITPMAIWISILIFGAIIFFTGLMIVLYNFLYNTVTLGFINYLSKIISKKRGIKNV